MNFPTLNNFNTTPSPTSSYLSSSPTTSYYSPSLDPTAHEYPPNVPLPASMTAPINAGPPTINMNAPVSDPRRRSALTIRSLQRKARHLAENEYNCSPRGMVKKQTSTKGDDKKRMRNRSAFISRQTGRYYERLLVDYVSNAEAETRTVRQDVAESSKQVAGLKKLLKKLEGQAASFKTEINTELAAQQIPQVNRIPEQQAPIHSAELVGPQPQFLHEQQQQQQENKLRHYAQKMSATLVVHHEDLASGIEACPPLPSALSNEMPPNFSFDPFVPDYEHAMFAAGFVPVC